MTESDRLRKAAILIDTLDTTRADALLDQMPESQRDRIRQMVMELEGVTDTERESVIAEFLGPEAAARMRHESPSTAAEIDDDVVVDFSPTAAREFANVTPSHAIPRGDSSALVGRGDTLPHHAMSHHAVSHHSATDHAASHYTPSQYTTPHPAAATRGAGDLGQPEWMMSPTSDRSAHHAAGDAFQSASSQFNHLAGACQPFSFLQGMEADTLAACLEYENPQAIALVVSQLKPEQAARVVACFTTRMQSDVVRRMSRLQDAEPEVLLDLEDYLRQRIAATSRQSADASHGPGVRALVRMLEVAGPVERRGLLANLADDRPALARHLARQFDIELKQISDQDGDELTTNQVAQATSLSDDGPLSQSDWTATYPVSLETHLDNPVPLTSNHGDVESAGEHAWMVTRPSVAPAPSPDLGGTTFSVPVEVGGAPAGVESANTAVDACTQEDTSVDAGVGLPDVSELSELDTRSLATLLQHAEPETLLIALAGAPRTVVEALMKCLSRREARRLRAQIEKIGPIRIDDFEFAQQRLIQIANELVEEGLIKLRRKRPYSGHRRIAA